MKTFSLKSGNHIPILGFGTWQITGEDCYQATAKALEVGYRHIDTADMYDNHVEIARAIQESSIRRDEIFLTSKIWQDDYKKEDVRIALERTLDELATDYLDLWLMHWPNREVPLAETLGAMKELQDTGLVCDIGVANFTENHLRDAIATEIPFSLNQVEFHPSLNQESLHTFCQDHDIALTAYSPIGRGEDLKLPLIQELAEAYEHSESQIILNWLIQKNIIAIPKATSAEHIEDNWNARTWSLSDEDMVRIDELDTGNRIINPSFADFAY